MDKLTQRDETPAHAVRLAAVGALGLAMDDRAQSPWDETTGWRTWDEAEANIVLGTEDADLDICIKLHGADIFTATYDDQDAQFHITCNASGRYCVSHNGVSYHASVSADPHHVSVFVRGQS
ncbi:MAG: hypothetical protein JKX69_06995 [Rhodobacteraceae bacterium]|nr:hypothetical protein [Paracoccaceae bacterium]PHR61309.1 MAG: hypothetical protein COA47_06015 [Robiginitomaculum sp.]